MEDIFFRVSHRVGSVGRLSSAYFIAGLERPNGLCRFMDGHLLDDGSAPTSGHGVVSGRTSSALGYHELRGCQRILFQRGNVKSLCIPLKNTYRRLV